MVAFLFGFICSAGAFWVLLKRPTPLLVLDVPTARGLHQTDVPRGGGIVITATVLLFAVWIALRTGFDWAGVISGVGLVGISALGYLDDHYHLTVKTRLVAQLLLMGLVVLVTLDSAVWRFFGYEVNLPTYVVLVPALVILVWMVNLFNFMDGADGLVGFQSLVAALTLGYWFGGAGITELAILNFSLAGSVGAFLWFNWTPARIFLGDSGSLTLGAWFGCMGIIGVTQVGLPFEAFLVLFGFFVFDASLTLMRRLFQGKPLSEPHRDHLYQRLILAGWSHPQVALLTGFLGLLMAICASLIVKTPSWGLWCVVVAGSVLVLFAIWASAIAKAPNRLRN